MECQDVRQLLAFLERKSEELDAAEHGALQKHLDACPECAALVAADRSADQAIGIAVRAVAVPAGLKLLVLQRLAGERAVEEAAQKSKTGRRPWKRWAGLAAAAMLLVAIGGGTLAFWPKPVVTNDELKWDAGAEWSKSSVEQFLLKQGLAVRAPDKFMYRYLQAVDVVVIHNRRVARLTFSRDDDQKASARVFIIDSARFNDADLRDDPTEIKIRRGEDHLAGFTYVIHYSGNLQSLENDFN